MISSGLAFAIGYAPYRLALVSANQDLLARLARNAGVMSNPKLKHAVEFATKGAKIEATTAAEKVNAVIARANAKGAALPPLSAAVAEWSGWIANVAARLKPMLAGSDAANGFDVGVAAAALMQAWGSAEKLAYLRAGAPDQPDLSAEAARHAAAIPGLTKDLVGLLARIDRPFVVPSLEWLQRKVGRAPRPDATSSKTYSSSYGEIVDWRKHVDDMLAHLESDLDVPIDPPPTSKPTAEEQKLFGEILARPADDELRRRYAELAARRRDPRAELIREQLAILELERRGELNHGHHPMRVQELLVSHPEWSAPLADFGARDVKFDRGFPFEITIDVNDFLTHAAALFARAPIVSVRLRGSLAGRGAALAAMPQLANLKHLDLHEQRVTDADIFALAASRHLSKLRTLDLGRNQLTNAGIETLVASAYLPGLERVNLEFNPGDDPVDRLEYYDETHQEPVPTDAGRALEQKYGPRRWFHPYGRDR